MNHHHIILLTAILITACPLNCNTLVITMYYQAVSHLPAIVVVRDTELQVQQPHISDTRYIHMFYALNSHL